MIKLLFSLLVVLNQVSAIGELKDAQDYHKNSDLQFKWAMECLREFPLAEDDKVLDLGCRTGSITPVIAAKVPNGIVIGLDSEAMLSHAREYYPASNIIYMESDLKSLPFIEQFDKACAFLSLNRVNEQKQALNSLYKALKFKGKAIITRPGKQPSNLWPVVHELIKLEHWAPYFPDFSQNREYFTADEYRLLLEEAGFVIEKISQDSTYTHFNDREALEGFFRPLCSFIHHLSSELQHQFVKELVDIVLNYNQILTDGSILLHDFKLEAIVSKT